MVDRLTTVALDGGRDEAVRLAALRTLEDLERSTIAPSLQARAGDENEAVRLEARRAQTSKGAGATNPAEEVTRAAESGLPDDPGGLAAAFAVTGGPGGAGSTIALALLLKLLERIREREAIEPSPRRAEWTRLRGTVHVALAGRRSRIALYDLRESLEGATSALPVEFLTALSKIGDASCVEAIAAAYARAGRVARDFSRSVAQDLVLPRTGGGNTWPRRSVPSSSASGSPAGMP